MKGLSSWISGFPCVFCGEAGSEVGQNAAGGDAHWRLFAPAMSRCWASAAHSQSPQTHAHWDCRESRSHGASRLIKGNTGNNLQPSPSPHPLFHLAPVGINPCNVLENIDFALLSLRTTKTFVKVPISNDSFSWSANIFVLSCVWPGLNHALTLFVYLVLDGCNSS